MNNALEVALKFIEKFKGCQYLTYRGELLEVNPGDDSALTNLEAGGMSEQTDKVFALRLSVFTDGIIPVENEKVIFDGNTYNIHKVERDATKTFIQLACTDTNRGV